MIAKKDILKIVHHILRRQRGTPDRRLMHSARDWVIGLFAAGMLCIVGSGYDGYLFFVEMRGEESVGVEQTETLRYENKTIATALKEYQQRVEQFENLRANQPSGPSFVEVQSTEVESGKATNTKTSANLDESETVKDAPVKEDKVAEPALEQ